MERMRRLRARIAPADAVALSTKLGVDVYQGRGVFTGAPAVLCRKTHARRCPIHLV
eukprot:SAG11_NODE_6197_length_1367_cov_1.216877_2_plen_55_part_01